MSQQHRDAGRKGRAAEHLAAAWLLHHFDTYVVMTPDPSSSDLLFQIDGQWKRAQVKLAYTPKQRPRSIVANVSKSNGDTYGANDCDYILVVFNSLNIHNFWLIPIASIAERTRINLRKYQQFSYAWDQKPELWTEWFSH